MTITESVNGVATQAREATEKSAETFKKGVETFTDRANTLASMPTLDLTEPVTRYFEYVQQAVDRNRDLAIKWAELLTSLTGTVREQAEKVGHIVEDQANTVADVATDQVKKAEDLAKQQAETAEEIEKEQARLARKAEREEAKQAALQAREPYEGLTKAELADQLAERELPKSGTIEELIERLVAADSS